MASNANKIVKRIMEMHDGRPVWNWGVFVASRSTSGRTLTQVLEGGTYQDAVKLAKGERTTGGHSVKGFRKLKV